MGLGKGSSTGMIKRAFRTLAFLVIMVFSLLVSCAPLLISVMDVMVPCILLSSFACCSSCFGRHGNWRAYNVRTSVTDIPLLSLIRSLAILCVYSVCGVPSLTYGPYFGATAICAVVSACALVIKTCIFFHNDIGILHRRHPSADLAGQTWMITSLFSCSMALALGHIIVAYKVKCRVQRKMQLCRLDPESMYGGLKKPSLYHMHKARDAMLS